MKREGLLMNRTTRQTKLADDEVIVLYRKGSRGDVMGLAESVLQIVDTEKRYNPKFSAGHIYKCLDCSTYSYTSLHYQCRIKPVIRKRSDIKHLP